MKCPDIGDECPVFEGKDRSGVVTFLGHDTNYWIELQARVDDLNVSALIEEIVHLRAKLYSYEKLVAARLLGE